MKRLPGRNAHRWKHPLSSLRAVQPPRHLSVPAPPRPPPLLPRARQSPEAHSWRFPLRYPADPAACGRPGEQGREAKGAAEGGAAACCRSPRPDTKRPARPAPPVPTRPAGLGAPPGSDPTSPHKQVSPPWPSRWPRALPIQTPPRRAAAAEAKAGGGAGEKPGSRARPLTRAPGAARVPPERCRRPNSGASAGDERGSAAIAGSERVEVADPARPPRRQVSPALPLGLRSSPSAPRRLPGGGRPATGRRPMGTPRAGWRYGPPTS